jgi:F0F1-type ATP synthase membrane subunit a
MVLQTGVLFVGFFFLAFVLSKRTTQQIPHEEQLLFELIIKKILEIVSLPLLTADINFKLHRLDFCNLLLINWSYLEQPL